MAPAALAALGTASSAIGHWFGAAMPFLLAASVALFARAHYTLWARGYGSVLARTATVGLTVLSSALWVWRLLPR